MGFPTDRWVAWQPAAGFALSVAALILTVACRAARDSLRLGGSAANRGAPALSQSPAPLPAPEFRVRTISGHELSLDALKGKVVLIDFWATWCPPCRKEIPEFNKLYGKYQACGVEVVGLALDEKRTDVTRFARALNISYPVALASKQIQDVFGGITVYPTAFLVDRRGKLVRKYLGFTYPEEFERDLRGLCTTTPGGGGM